MLYAFPLLNRKQWIADVADEGARLGLVQASELFVRRIREEQARLRRLGMSEAAIAASTLPAKERLKDEIRERTAKLNKGYTLQCFREDVPDLKPGDVLQRSAY